ncbi:MAG: hypothetical protein HEQ38_10220 [Gemmatimonas sp.]|nr:hypothetical protein [Gemmatimonas sp.]
MQREASVASARGRVALLAGPVRRAPRIAAAVQPPVVQWPELPRDPKPAA